MTGGNNIVEFTDKFYGILIKQFLGDNLNEWNSFIEDEFSKHEQSKTVLYCDSKCDDDDNDRGDYYLY
jgi:hypothetical protein